MIASIMRALRNKQNELWKSLTDKNYSQSVISKNYQILQEVFIKEMSNIKSEEESKESINKLKSFEIDFDVDASNFENLQNYLVKMYERCRYKFIGFIWGNISDAYMDELHTKSLKIFEEAKYEETFKNQFNEFLKSFGATTQDLVVKLAEELRDSFKTKDDSKEEESKDET
jgi:hypothetical protein